MDAHTDLDTLLRPPERALWERYLALERAYKRRPALATLDQFPAAFETYPAPERDAWVAAFLAEVVDRQVAMPLRHPLRRRVLVPALQRWLAEDRPDAARWAARLSEGKDAAVARSGGTRTGDLFEAVVRRHRDVVRAILDTGADPNIRDDTGRTPLWVAANWERSAVVRLLLARGADPNARDCDGRTPLLSCLGNLDIAEELMAHGADVNLRGEHGNTPLLHYAGSRDPALVVSLLAHGADIEAANAYGYTPLMLSAGYGGYQHTFRVLLDAGARCDVRAHDGSTALMWAARGGNTEAIHCLLDRGADLHARAADGGTAILWAAAEGQTETVRYLLERQAHLEDTDASGSTPLLAAAEGLHPETVDLLLRSGAAASARHGEGQNALGRASLGWTGAMGSFWDEGRSEDEIEEQHSRIEALLREAGIADEGE